MERYIDLKKLSLDELAGVINLYPWFGSARKELCERMAGLGGEDWGAEQYADAAMYLPSRRMISDMVHSVRREDYADKDISAVIRRYIAEDSGSGAGKMPENGVSSGRDDAGQRQVRVVGGDYFSQQEYDHVRKEEDGVFSRFAGMAKQEMTPQERREHESLEFCTETLAQIYAEQGYYDHAIHIYEKLILAYPEKNAYFAALIEKLKTED